MQIELNAMLLKEGTMLKNKMIRAVLVSVLICLAGCDSGNKPHADYPVPEDQNLYKSFYYNWRYGSMKKFVNEKEANRNYDSMLLYQKPMGEPIFWVKPGNKTTLFFMEGFRAQVGIGVYRSWLKELHEKHSVNIIGPVIGLQGWPFEYRNRQWFFQEDMRQSLQIYDAYTAGLPPDHRIIVMSQSFGALGNAAIMARATRKPDVTIMMSPLNTGLVYKSGSKIIQWLAQRKGIVRHIVPFSERKMNPARAGYWDIVNDEKNRQTWETIAKDTLNWEENVNGGYQVDMAAILMENSVIPEIHGMKIVLLHGDDDLYFSNEGFGRLAGLLRKSGNTVDSVGFKDTGHMILFDNGGDEAKNIILSVLENRYDIKNTDSYAGKN
jgi:hypothetical protein